MSELRGKRLRRHREIIAYVTSHPPENPWRRHAAFHEMFAGAMSRAAALGFGMKEFDLVTDGMTGERMKSILIARGIRGVLIAPLPDEHTVIDMDLRPFAAVALGVSLQSPPLERVSNDHYQSMRLAFHRCVELGFRRIGFFVGKAFSERLENRWLGAYVGEQALLPASRRLRPLILESVVIKDREPVIAAWVKRERPDVVIAPLGGAAHAEYKAHIDTLPDSPAIVDLAVPQGRAGFAGILQDNTHLGEIGVERVVSRLHQNDFGPLSRIQNILMHGAWVDNASLAERAAGLG